MNRTIEFNRINLKLLSNALIFGLESDPFLHIRQELFNNGQHVFFVCLIDEEQYFSQKKAHRLACITEDNFIQT